MALQINPRLADGMSYRDVKIATKQETAGVQRVANDTATLNDQAAAVESSISTVDTQITTAKTALAAANAAHNVQQIQAQTDAINTLQSQRTQLISKRNTINVQRDSVAADAQSAAMVKVAAAAGNTALTSATSTNSTSALGTKTKPTNKGLQYNASTVQESYFSSTPAFTKEMNITGNSPSALSSATQLWTSAKTSKGMIVTSQQTLKAWNSGSQQPTSANKFDNHNYGFQFMYNPGTVNMSYYTSPNIDVTMMTSGQDLFNLSGVSGSQGSVSFQIVINRIFDMQYYKSDGTLKQGARTKYSKPPVNAAEERMLWEKGTMYDIEFLLRTLMGTTMSSYLRGENTADMGWLPAMPVELHLGSKLRYLGTVNSFSLNHAIFNERMVPLFTTCDISFARLPDYPATAGN
jgi:hypothetical protein